jgi:hypothetical protein
MEGEVAMEMDIYEQQAKFQQEIFGSDWREAMKFAVAAGKKANIAPSQASIQTYAAVALAWATIAIGLGINED